jgi:hypothetical protein
LPYFFIVAMSETQSFELDTALPVLHPAALAAALL